jgi:acyl carrier protein
MFDSTLFRMKVAEFASRPASEIADDTLLTELVTESFALVEMLIELQEEFHVRFLAQDELRDVRTVGDLVALFEGHATAAAAGEKAPPKTVTASGAADPVE